MKRNYLAGLIALTGFLMMNSCQKDTAGEQDNVQQAIISNTFETVSNDIFKTFLYGVLAVNDSLYRPNDSNSLRLNDPCLTYYLNTADTLVWPKTLHMVFPAEGCQCADGINRAGELIIEMPGPSWPLHAGFTVTFNNYTVASTMVSGYKHISIIDKENYSFTDTTFISSSVMSTPMQWSAVHQLEWILGNNTPANIADDLFIYGGKASCAANPAVAEDILFNVTIVDALQFANFCYWIGSGKAELFSPGHSITTITYSDSCLNQAVLCRDNEFQTINF